MSKLQTLAHPHAPCLNALHGPGDPLMTSQSNNPDSMQMICETGQNLRIGMQEHLLMQAYNALTL